MTAPLAPDEDPDLELAPPPAAALELRRTSPVLITSEQIAVIKATLCQDATPAEMQLFFYDCQRRGVHPLDKLIHFTKRRGKYTPVTSIDFFRSRAGDTGEHMGTEDAILDYGINPDVPILATVRVYRNVQGQKCAFTASARMREYMPEAPNDFMWRKMPSTMLSKCAEALALRKAFPQQLGGLYTVDEMAQDADPGAPAKSKKAAPEKAAPVITQAQRTRFFAIAKKAGWPKKEDLSAWLKEAYGLTSSKQIPKARYDEICAAVEKGPAKVVRELTVDEVF